MKRAYVMAYKANGFYGKLITWFTLGDISHVSFIYEDDSGVWEIEAVGRGVVKHRFDPNEERERDLLFASVSEGQFLVITQAMNSIVGSGYDWPGIWGFLRKKRRENPNKWFCSEKIAWGFRKMRRPISRKKDFQHTPTDIAASYVLTHTLIPERWLNV